MRQRGDVFDGLNCQASLLKGGNGVFATASWSFDLDFDFFHAKFYGFFRRLLGRLLASEGGTFPAPFETTGSCGGPTKGVPFRIGHGHGRIIKSRLDMHDTRGNISFNFFLFRCFCHCELNSG